jgi:hypothetical protein
MARMGENSPSSTILGAAGEHFVMCQLLRRNMIAALAPTGVPNTDIVVTDNLGDRLCAIQVKVRRELGSDGGWHMGEKHETLVSPNLFYCFVNFGSSLVDQPKTWVIPSEIVAQSIRYMYGHWLATPGKNDRPHRDGNFRRFLPEYKPLSDYKMGWLNPYFENWRSLEAASKRNASEPVGRISEA